MDRLTRAQAEAQLAALGGYPSALNWGDVDAEIECVLQEHREAVTEGYPFAATLRILIAHKAHLDFEAGRASASAPPADAIVKPGDRIQDMEALYRMNGTRILYVDALVTKDGKPAAQCSGLHGDKATIRLDRIHRKNIKSGWRVLDKEAV